MGKILIIWNKEQSLFCSAMMLLPFSYMFWSYVSSYFELIWSGYLKNHSTESIRMFSWYLFLNILASMKCLRYSFSRIHLSLKLLKQLRNNVNKRFIHINVLAWHIFSLENSKILQKFRSYCLIYN